MCGIVRDKPCRPGELPAQGLGEKVNGGAARTKTLLDHRERLTDIGGGEVMRCAAHRGICPLLHGLVRSGGRCADDGTQPVLGAAQLIEILLEGGSPFRYLQNLLLLDA